MKCFACQKLQAVKALRLEKIIYPMCKECFIEHKDFLKSKGVKIV